MPYDILAIICIDLPCVSECIYVCMYVVRHDIQIPCIRYMAINRLYLFIFNSFDRNTKSHAFHTCKIKLMVGEIINLCCAPHLISFLGSFA